MKKKYCGVFMTGYISLFGEDANVINSTTERLSKMNLVDFNIEKTHYGRVLGVNLRFPVEKIVAIKKLAESCRSKLSVLDFDN